MGTGITTPLWPSNEQKARGVFKPSGLREEHTSVDNDEYGEEDE